MLITPITMSPANFRAWRDSPETQEVIRVLLKEREDWAKKLIEGYTLVQGQEIAETAKVVGIIFGLDCFLIGVETMLRSQWEEREEGEDG